MRVGIFAAVKAYVVTVAVVFTAAALILTIYYTHENLQWMAFLTGVLIASVLAEAARASRSEWVLMRRTAQLSSMKDKFEFEMRLRKSNERKFADFQALLQLVDDVLPTMIVLVDADVHCRYHNRAFRDWLQMKKELVDGRHLRELLGSRSYAEIATAVQQSLDGQPLHYEHFQHTSNQAVYHLLVEHVPQFDTDGRVTGFYFLAEDITRRGDLISARQPGAAVKAAPVKQVAAEHADRPLPDAGPVVGRQDEGKLFIAAIQNGEFKLYCQLISQLPLGPGKTAHYAILIRMMEEEGNLVPPGAFFPMAEKAGLMPYLDRWVVQQVLDWTSKQQSLAHESSSVYFINIANATIGDPEFPHFLKNILNELGMPGSILCFEVPEFFLIDQHHSVVEFIRQVRECGCCVAISEFGRHNSTFDEMRGFQIDFLKIDGGLILNMLNAPEDLAKVITISRIARKIGIKTVAELVESEEIVEKLTEIGIDFSQGSSISRPRPLTE